MAYDQKRTGLQNDGGWKKQIGRRNEIKAVWTILCVLLLVTAVGCGKTEEPVLVESIFGDMEEMPNDTAEDGDHTESDMHEEDEDDSIGAGDEAAQDGLPDHTGEEEKNNTQNDMADEESGTDAQAQSMGSVELDGNVLSLNGDSFVVSRNETYTDGEASVMVGAAPGYEAEEDRITVHVSEGCVWEFLTVKNGGINPEDVSAREGSFGDLKEGISVHMNGSWQDDGSFLADNIEMSIFV